MKKTLLTGGILLVLGVLAVISYSQQVNPQPYVVPWSNRSFRANKADSVKDGTGNYKPVSEIVAGDTAKNAWRADSVKWGGVYKLLSAFLPDSFGLFLRLHAKADTAADAINARNADSLNHKFPDFDVDLLAESLAVKLAHVRFTNDSTKVWDSLALKAPKASPTFTGRDSGVVAIRDTVRIVGAGGTGRIWYDQTGGWTSINDVASVVGAGGALVQFIASGNSGLGMQTAADFTYQSHLNFNAQSYVPHKIQCSELDLSEAGSRMKAFIYGFKTYAKGQRPASPVLGDIIMIDGDTTTDSLLVYMGGVWKLLME